MKFSTAVFSHFLKIITFAVLIFLFSCKKDESTTPVFDTAKQALKDDTILVKYFEANGLSSLVTKTSSGLYYRKTKITPDSIGPRPDSLYPNPDFKEMKDGDLVFIRYEGRLLNDTLFDGNLLSANAFQFRPGFSSVISGWNEGVRLFKKSEEGYLYLPSGLAYRNAAQGKIPASSCIKFFIRIANIE